MNDRLILYNLGVKIKRHQTWKKRRKKLHIFVFHKCNSRVVWFNKSFLLGPDSAGQTLLARPSWPDHAGQTIQARPWAICWHLLNEPLSPCHVTTLPNIPRGAWKIPEGLRGKCKTSIYLVVWPFHTAQSTLYTNYCPMHTKTAYYTLVSHFIPEKKHQMWWYDFYHTFSCSIWSNLSDFFVEKNNNLFFLRWVTFWM